MKKIVLKSLVASSLLCSSLLADSFVGVFGGYSLKSEFKLKDDSGSDIEEGDIDKLKLDDKKVNLGVKAGYDFDSFRVYGAYRYNFKAKDSYFIDNFLGNMEWKSHDFLIGADYTPSITDSFKFSLGIYGGISRLNMRLEGIDYDDNSKDSFSKDKTGFIYGAKIGGIYELDENNEVEFGYQIDESDYGKIEDVKIKVRDHGLYLGYNYKF